MQKNCVFSRFWCRSFKRRTVVCMFYTWYMEDTLWERTCSAKELWHFYIWPHPVFETFAFLWEVCKHSWHEIRQGESQFIEEGTPEMVRMWNSKRPGCPLLSPTPGTVHRGSGIWVIPPGIRTSTSCPSSHFCFRETPHPRPPPPSPYIYNVIQNQHVIATSAATRDTGWISVQVAAAVRKATRTEVRCPVCLYES